MSSLGLLTGERRLPGLRFEAQPPPLGDVLPRMDVAVFVGFASSGPINQPVVIEDSAQFTEIFGEDALLAWDEERGQPKRAYLGSAVRDFFRQGGRRCWIIRVARDAKYNFFPIPALLELTATGDLFPAFARARSEGSWSDALRVGATLRSRPIEVTRASFAENSFELNPNSPADVQLGDLLRFKVRDEGYGLFAVVESANAVEPAIESPPREVTSVRQRIARRTLRVQCANPLWFNTHWLAGLTRPRVCPVTIVNEDGSSGPLLENVFYWSLSDQGQSFILHFKPPAALPQAGTKLLVDYFDAQLLLTVQASVDEAPLVGSPPETVQIFGRVERLTLPRPSRVLVFDGKREGRAIGVVERPTLESGKIKLTCSLTLAVAPAPGTVMRVDFGVRQLWLTAQRLSSIPDASGSSPTGSVQIEGEGFWRLVGPPFLLFETLVEAERLNFDLLVQGAGDKPSRLNDLGFDERHSRFWGAWPTDAQRYEHMTELAFTVGARSNETATREVFPVAASEPLSSTTRQRLARELYLPIAMPFVTDAFLGAVETRHSALERDGLALVDEHGELEAAFGSDLFLDSAMVDTSIENLLSQADYLRYQSPRRRKLKGIHAALDIQEASIIAVPDAVHRNWTRRRQDLEQPRTSDLLAHPRWWRYLDCNPAPDKLPLANQPAWENFLDCDLRVLAAPHLESETETPSGTIALVWSTIEGATRYVVEESRSASWHPAEVVYSGPNTRVVIYGRTAGDYFYRVRAETGDSTSEWAVGISVRTSSRSQWQVEKKEDYTVGPLLDLQRALLRMCAARADIFAVLTLPEHFREDDVITHAQALKPANRSSIGEDRATSYGALYHPWLITRRDDPFESWQVVPPDGAACGVIARRAITRGAWTAPANELLRGVVALAPPLAAERRLELQNAQVNIFRHEPRGFLSLCADTLSSDVDLRPINVRLLLILLRRLALRLGETYVFEPNDDSFRRMVQRGFEAALDRLFARGAFAGRTAATSYQVVTDESLNTPASVDQGRFIVELRVAPSLPLTFITVRLVQTNDRSLVTEVR